MRSTTAKCLHYNPDCISIRQVGCSVLVRFLFVHIRWVATFDLSNGAMDFYT